MKSPALLKLLDRRKYVEDQLFRSVKRLYLESYEDVRKGSPTAKELIEQFLAVVRSRAGLHRQRNRHEAIALEIKTLKSMLQWAPTNAPTLQLLTKTKDILNHRMMEMVKNAKNLYLDEEGVKLEIARIIKIAENDQRETQSHRAKKPRPNAMSKILDSLVERNPTISERDAIKEIRKMAGNGVIYEVTEKCIEMDPEEYTNEYGKKIYKKGKSIPISSIRTKLSQAKKRYQKRISSD